MDKEESSIIEAKANRFAAEFLLPKSVLEGIIIEEFKTSSLQKTNHKTLLRFIARLQCTWWLPYRSIVKRLREIKEISFKQYDDLYAINERNLDCEYSKIGQAINKETFIKLNKPSYNIGTSPNIIENIIRNFEDNIIDEDKFAVTLNLFNKKPEDFGYEMKISQEDT